jgi:transposase InsO family protein
LRRPVESGQFVSLAFGQQARDAGIAVSMRGDAYDNAAAESFFATLKKELIRRHSWPTRRELTGDVFDYIEAFYSPVRRHSTLGCLSPGPSSSLALRHLQNEDQTDNDLTNVSAETGHSNEL